jgi:hypothetical protein
MSDYPELPHDDIEDMQNMPDDEQHDESVPPPPENMTPRTDSSGISSSQSASDNDNMRARLERLGGEPAPDITPEEFARLRQSGQIHIDPRGRVRSQRSSARDEGVTLRKRRAWY